jgi:hypothetical protein
LIIGSEVGVTSNITCTWPATRSVTAGVEPLLGAYGRVDTSLGAQFSGTLSATAGGVALGSIPFSRSDMIQDTLTGFGDLLPIFSLRWNAGVNNYMVYLTGDVPVGAYNPSRLSNIGIGHGTVDAGFGYTYLNTKTGQEFSGVLGFTTSLITRPNIRMALTCISTGPHRSF